MMKKLFTSLLLLTALLCSSVVKAQTIVWDVDYSSSQWDPSNFQLILNSDGNYVLKVKNNNYPASFPRLNDSENGFSQDEVRKFKDSNKKITIEGTFSNIDGLKKDFKFEEVNLKDFVMSSNNEPVNFTYTYRIKDYFKHAKKVTLPDYETDVYVDFFLDMNRSLEEITFGSNTKRILCIEQGTQVSSNGVWSAWEREQNPDPQGNYPIKNAPALKTLNFNDGLEEIGTNAFLNCANITSLTFPTSLKVIHINAFKHTKEITSLDFSNNKNLTTIDASAFAGKSNKAGERSKLSSVTLPPYATFTGFGNYVFSSTSIEELNFSNCTGITRFLHDGGTNDPQYQGKFKTFYYYSSLKRIWFPPNLTYVMPDIFGGQASAESGLDLTNSDNVSTILEEAYFTGHITKDAYDLSKCEDASQKDVISEGKGLEIDKQAFSQVTTLRKVVLSNNVWRIGEEAFKQCHLTEISIPASVQIVETKAFEQNDYLTKVIFEEITDDCKPCKGRETRIQGGDTSGGQGHGAFNNCKAITDVYINTTSNLSCQNNAFDQHITWGAGDAEKPFATLHFPKEKLNHYVNTKHYLTDAIAADNGAFHNWLMKHYFLAGDPNMNGWWEFINSGPSSSDLTSPGQEIILRTFSDYELSYIVPSGLRAYIVNHVDVDLSSKVATVTLKRINAIPAKTGVIIYGHPNGIDIAGNPTLSLTPVYFPKNGDTVYDDEGHEFTWTGEDQGLALCRANWTKNGESMKNYLEPTSTDPNYSGTDHPEWQNGGIFLKPYENVQGKENPLVMNPKEDVAFRNFGLGRYNSIINVENKQELNADDGEVNYAAFFRLVKGLYGKGKAYLHMSATEYPVEQGAEILVNKDETAGAFSYYWEFGASDGKPYDFRDAANVDKNKKGWWNPREGFDWDVVSDRFAYTDDQGNAILDDEGNPIVKTRLNWGFCPDRLQTIDMALKYLGELEETDDIVKMVIPAAQMDNADYYTLQGVKVTNPTKGVYISNGKKVIIK